jgi:hypothetical protein
MPPRQRRNSRAAPVQQRAVTSGPVDGQIHSTSTANEELGAPTVGRPRRTSTRLPRALRTSSSPSPSPPPRKRRATQRRIRSPAAVAAQVADPPVGGYAILSHQIAELTGALNKVSNDLLVLQQQAPRNPPTGPASTILSPPPAASVDSPVVPSPALSATLALNPATGPSVANPSVAPPVVLPPVLDTTLASHTLTVQHAVNLSVASAAPGEQENVVTSPDGNLFGDIVDPKIQTKIWGGHLHRDARALV